MHFLHQMNANSQSSSSLKQLRLQIPTTSLEAFATSINELVEMYPFNKENQDEQDE